jgi:glycerophosphoryl diester phosphodiesterase
MSGHPIVSWPYPRVFAHRCGGTLAPENTLAGLQVAQRFGTGVEFDVMLSGSGSPVLIHDETLARTTNGRGRVADTPDEVLRTLDAGSRFSARFAGEPLPTLEQAAARCIVLGLSVNLEIKPATGQDVATARVAAQVAAHLWRDTAHVPLLSSFSEQALQAAAETSPALPRGLLVEAIPSDWRERCCRLGVVALHCRADKLDRARARLIREAGLWIVVYTENDPARARTLFEWGVDCVITDRPDLIVNPNAPIR